MHGSKNQINGYGHSLLEVEKADETLADPVVVVPRVVHWKHGDILARVFNNLEVGGGRWVGDFLCRELSTRDRASQTGNTCLAIRHSGSFVLTQLAVCTHATGYLCAETHARFSAHKKRIPSPPTFFVRLHAGAWDT